MLSALYRLRNFSLISLAVTSVSIATSAFRGCMEVATLRKSSELAELRGSSAGACGVSSIFFLRLGKDCMGDGLRSFGGMMVTGVGEVGVVGDSFLLLGSLDFGRRRVGAKTSLSTCSCNL
jgi:hypothetical protein